MTSFVSIIILAVLATIEPVGAASKHFLGVSSPAASSLDVPNKVPSGAEFTAPAHGDALASFQDAVANRLRRVRAVFLQSSQRPRTQPITWKEYSIDALLTWAMWFVLAAATYFCCYRPQSPLPQLKADAMPDWERLEELLTTGHWQCLDDSNICLCSFLCPSLRWADTTSLAGWLTFLAAWAALSGLALLNVATTGAIYGLFTAILMLYFRQQLRDKLGMETRTFGTCCRDFCFVCWCPCCSIAQEARIVKEAIQMGHEAFPAPAASM